MANLNIRKLVSDRAEGCCEYCMSQEKFSSQAFSIEHIHPLSLGGNNNPDNLALACQGCNNHKYTKTFVPDPETGQDVLLFNPRTDTWLDHFQWNENHTVIKGLTPNGRATVLALKLNRDFLINQRIIYRAYGIHPPRHSVL